MPRKNRKGKTKRKRKGKKLSQELEARLNKDIAEVPETLNVFEQQIIILDGGKEFYDDAIYNLDLDNTKIINQSDQNMVDVQSAYQARVDAGCKSDLLWRVVGLGSTTTQSGPNASLVTTYETLVQCIKTDADGYPEVENQSTINKGFSPGGVGFQTDKLLILDNTQTGNVPNTILVKDLDTKYGLLQENRYAIKIYDQPMGQDVGDSSIASFIGTCSAGQNFITLMQPVEDRLTEQLQNALFVICDKKGVLPNVGGSEVASIVGLGTTVADLSPLGSGLEYRPNVVVYRLNILGGTAGSAQAPEPNTDGQGFVDFTLLGTIDGVFSEKQRIKNLALRESSKQDPYSPQTIFLMEGETEYSYGYETELVNNGHQRSQKSWNPEESTEHLKEDGKYPDFYEDVGLQIVEEPEVGGGKITYNEGFDTRPENPTNGNPASEGDTYNLGNITIAPSLRPVDGGVPGFQQPAHGNTSGSNCGARNAAINSAINIKDDYISDNLVKNNGEAKTDIRAANTLRDERKENYEERIWSLRLALGASTNTRDRQRNAKRRINEKRKKVDRDD